MRLIVLPGKAHGFAGSLDLLEVLSFGTLIGVKAFDAEWLLGEFEAHEAEAVVPSRRSRPEPRDHDWKMYKWRYKIQNFFPRIRAFRAAAMQCDKTDESFAAGIHLVAGVVAAK